MKRVKQIAERWFKKTEANATGNGLYATLEELMEQRQYIGYLRQGTKKMTTSANAGDVKSAFKGRGIELEEIRPYTFGDDVRDIDWRVTARKQTPYTKLFTEERDREVYVLLDLSPKMLFGTRVELKSVAAAKIASLLGWLSLQNKDRFGCVVFDGENSFIFKPQNNRAGVIAILKKVADVSREVLQKKNDLSADLAKPVQLLQKSIKSNAIVFVISDFNDHSENLQKNLAALGRKSSLFCINVYDVLEETAPPKGEYLAENNRQRLVFNTASKDFRQDYYEYFAAKRQSFKDFCNKFACRCLEVRTDIPLYKQIKIF